MRKSNTTNKTKGDKLVYSLGEHDETLHDIVLQIWNDGAEGIFYDGDDFEEFEGRIRAAIKREGRKNG